MLSGGRDFGTVQTSDKPLRSIGLTASGVRNHNERAVLSKLRATGQMAGMDVARSLGVSAQTASVILRSLEANQLVLKGERVRGKVGKPQLPYRLNPSGAFALGLRLGRRSSDLVLTDFTGQIVSQQTIHYRLPIPSEIEKFLRRATPDLLAAGGAPEERVIGIGIATPFELWNWPEVMGAPRAEVDGWRNYDFQARLGDPLGLPVTVANDVNMACSAELVFGAGRMHRGFAYFNIGFFVGGGVVLDGKVLQGERGNAGAFGSIPVLGTRGPNHQLIHAASLYALEEAISEARGTVVNIRSDDSLFAAEPALCAQWLEQAAEGLAVAITAVLAVLDLQQIIIDGAFPAEVRDRLIARTIKALEAVDHQGLHPVHLSSGVLGHNAGALGAAYAPTMEAYFLEGSQMR